MTPQRGLSGWIARNPLIAVLAVGLSGLFVGTAFGAAAASSDTAPQAARIDDTSRLRAEARTAVDQLAEVTRERDDLQTKVEGLTARAKTAAVAVKKLSAKAEVPDFTGDDAASARADDAVDLISVALDLIYGRRKRRPLFGGFASFEGRPFVRVTRPFSRSRARAAGSRRRGSP